MKNIVIIGAGPGGYEAALKASELGGQVTLIEKDKVGGTCLNYGCIPTKSLLSVAERYKEIQNSKDFGITVENLSINAPEVFDRKERIVKLLVKSIEDLLEENNVNLIRGEASLKDKNTVLVKEDNTLKEIQADSIILATGALRKDLEGLNINDQNILSSKELLSLGRFPESAIIIGGNVEGVEIAQFLSRFGTKVTIIEALDHILPSQDTDVARVLSRAFKKEKIKILTKTKVKEIIDEGQNIKVLTDSGKELKAEIAIISVGRVPNTSIEGLKELGITIDDYGFIEVDQNYQTSIPGIYAIGDLINTPALAHVATREGILVAEHILDNKNFNYSQKSLSSCIFTDPEIASTGIQEDSLKETNKVYKTGKSFYKELGKAHASGKTEGFFKIITDEHNTIIGAVIVGEDASALISKLSLAIEFGLSSDQLRQIIYPHPTLSEGIMNAVNNIQ